MEAFSSNHPYEWVWGDWLESDNQRFELRIRLARAAGVPVLTVARTGGASQSEHDSWIEDTTVQYGLVTSTVQ